MTTGERSSPAPERKASTDDRLAYVLWPIDSPERMGGKARALVTAGRAGLPVPPWFVVSPEALLASIPADDRARLSAGDPAVAQEILDRVCLANGVRAELDAALARLSPAGEPVAVRSSASDEDGPRHSFAGQLESFLFVPLPDAADKIRAVWRSGASARIAQYRREHGLAAVSRIPGVLIQRMIHAEVAGVAFGADPVTGRRGIAIVSAVFGLGTSLVSGESDADTYQVDRSGAIVSRVIARKRSAHRPAPDSPEGIRIEPIEGEDGSRPTLTDDQVREVAELARAAGRAFGRPQDIEWAIEEGRLYLLQSRPVTSIETLPDPDAILQVWDNSNIIESYSGVTTPLTFSFACEAYEGVYRQFCRLMRVPGGAIAAHDDAFANMLGLIRGRVYYNLLNWYRVLAMLPGFSMNRQFMEQMMGVKEGVPPEILAEQAPVSFTRRAQDGLRLASTITGLISNHWRLDQSMRAFYRRLDTALAPPDPPLDRMRLDELTAYYKTLRRQLLTRWDAPLVNDFFAMIFYGLLRRLTIGWVGDPDGALQNDLIGGEGGMISAEPARRIQEMARAAAADPDVVYQLSDGTPEAAVAAITRLPRLRELYDQYLARFGERCLDELKLESATLHDDPLPLLRAVGRLARRTTPQANPTADSATTPSHAARRHAEERIEAALARHTVRRRVFRWVLHQARARVRDRENLRFERTRLFGRVRRIFIEAGRRLHAEAALADPQEVFYLTVDEILAFTDGRAVTTDLGALAAARRVEFERYRGLPAPPSRFETHGAVHLGDQFVKASREPADARPPDARSERRGLGCSPGIVRAPVQIVTDPTAADLEPGAILVAERTDPGWIMIFPAASGVLVERGSLLSHSAIVARELGIPAIVSIPDVTTWLRTGDWVEMDGSTGTVRRLPPREPPQ